jgi:DNA-binding helix-hairpin-helix protein with protein kinase domain
MKTVVYKKQRIQLDEKNSLGSGGEAIVILHDKLAFKVYHNPSIDRAKKLEDFISLKLNLPENIAAPIDLVYDVKYNIVGFTMPVAKKAKEMINLSNKKFRAQEQISTNEME